MSHILLVEDRDSLRRMTRRALEQEGHQVTAVADGEEGIRRLEAGRFDLVLTDLKLPGLSGVDVVRACRRLCPETPVVVLTAFGTVTTAVEAMKLGAVDFLEKPVEIDDLARRVHDLTSRSGEEDEGLAVPGERGTPGHRIVGSHPAMRAAFRLVKKVAPTESTVLLSGETGTGKELFARAIHAYSKRSRAPFVAVNCAAIPEALMENELFGHEKGAYTGAGQTQRGRFEMAEGGTIFLDEIGELALEVQGKILRVLEERIYERIGGGRPRRADVRVVAATNRDLRRMAAGGTFRQDLLFRLDVFPITLPPLRERPSDVPEIARHLLRDIAERLGNAAPHLTAAAAERLQGHGWPGNVRELANVLERAVILDEHQEIRATDLDVHLPVPAPPDDSDDGERREIRDVLIRVRGDRRRAAEELGMSLRTLQRRIKQYGLEGVEYEGA